jgi:hypothetical protein
MKRFLRQMHQAVWFSVVQLPGAAWHSMTLIHGSGYGGNGRRHKAR